MKIKHFGRKKDFKKETCNLLGGAVFLWLIAEIFTESKKFCEQNNISTRQSNQIEERNDDESI